MIPDIMRLRRSSSFTNVLQSLPRETSDYARVPRHYLRTCEPLGQISLELHPIQSLQVVRRPPRRIEEKPLN